MDAEDVMDWMTKGKVLLALEGALLVAVGCNHDEGGGSGDTEFCDTDVVPEGDWDTAPYDWSDANLPGPEDNNTLPGIEDFDGGIVSAVGGEAPLAVHGIHMSTGQAMLFHGHQDQFV